MYPSAIRLIKDCSKLMDSQNYLNLRDALKWRTPLAPCLSSNLKSRRICFLGSTFVALSLVLLCRPLRRDTITLIVCFLHSYTPYSDSAIIHGICQSWRLLEPKLCALIFILVISCFCHFYVGHLPLLPFVILMLPEFSLPPFSVSVSWLSFDRNMSFLVGFLVLVPHFPLFWWELISIKVGSRCSPNWLVSSHVRFLFCSLERNINRIQMTLSAKEECHMWQ